MRTHTETANVAIVGGGIAGLTAAALLARQGRTAILLEKASHLGGRAITSIERDFHLNLGPHAWYFTGRATEIVRALGVPLHGRTPAPTGAYAIHNDGLHALPIGFISMLTTDLLSIRGKLEVARVLASFPRMNTSALDRVTVTEWLDDVVSDPTARLLLAALVRTATYVQSPGLLSAGAAVAQLKLALKGNVWYLDGGWQRLVDAVAERAASAGACLLTGVHARGVIIESGRARGVMLDDGGVVAADNVILATPPDAARELLGDHFAGQQTIAAKAACLDLGLARLRRPAAQFALGIDRPLYYSVHSATASLAPDGQAVIHAAKYLDPVLPIDPKQDEAELEGLMDRLQPGWRSDVVVRRFLPSMTVTHAVPAAAAGGLAGRPPVIVEGVAGLYLAGAGVGNEGQLANAAVVSAARAAELILQSSVQQAA